jgi:hypothetical protein
VVVMTSFILLRRMNRSISSAEVTQTGHPGPESRVMFSGSNPRIPFLEIDMVWVPHTSISRMSLGCADDIIAISVWQILLS